MSNTEYHTGKLVPIEQSFSLEDTARLLLKEHNQKSNDIYDSYLEQFREFFYKEYAIYNGEIYRIDKEHSSTDDEDISIAHKNQDGTIDFTIRFYNGGCSFDEALENAILKLEKK